MVSPGPAGEEVAGQRRISLVTEALAYVGAILVLAGGGAAVAQRWDDLGAWAHVSVFAGTAAFFLVVGVLLFAVHDAAVQRLVGVLWFLSSVGVGVAAGHRGVRGLRRARRARSPVDRPGDGRLRGRAVAGPPPGAAERRPLRRSRPHRHRRDPRGRPGPARRWSRPSRCGSSGSGWALLGWRRYVEPLWVSLPLGVLLALVAPAVAVYDYGWMYAVAIATAAVVMTLSVPLHNTPLLGVGTVGMFGYVTATVVRYFGDSLGVPAALAITGVVILVLAVVTARLARLTRSTPPEAPDQKPTPPGDLGEHELPKAS